MGSLGFCDVRTDLERQLAPAVPASRNLLTSGTLSLNLVGGLLDLARKIASIHSAAFGFLSQTLDATGIAPLGVNIVEQTLPGTEPRQPDKPQISPLAFGDLSGAGYLVPSKLAQRVGTLAIRSAVPPAWQSYTHASDLLNSSAVSQRLGTLFHDTPQQGAWSEPNSFAPQYPYNRVVETESGHVFELDDTPGAQRVHLAHRAGSFIEIHPDGSMVIKSVKQGYLITLADQFISVSGNCTVNIKGSTTLQVTGDVSASIDGRVTLNSKSDVDLYGKNIGIHARREVYLDAPVVKLGGYTTLPTSLTPIMGVLVPRCKFSSSSSSSPMDDLPSVDIQSTPLSSPETYDDASPMGVQTRAILFDNPDELGATAAYSAHVDALSSLGELGSQDRQLPGVVRQSDLTLPAPEPPIHG